MAVRMKKRLGDMLIEAGVITQEQLLDALSKQKQLGLRLGETLVELNFTDEEKILEALHKQMNIPIARIREAKIPAEVIAIIPESYVRKYNVLPFELDPQNLNLLRIAMSDPLDIVAVDDLAMLTNMQIEPMVATASDVRFGIERYYGNEQVSKMADAYTEERRKQQKERSGKQQEEDTSEVDTAPIVLLVNKIIEQAVNERASDIHIEPMETALRVRFRIDGAMQEMMRYEYELSNAIAARIKIISGMDIAEKRAPQDGRMTMKIDRLEYDIRVSSLPTVYGEKIVMRIANKQALTRDKKDLGFPDKELERFEQLIASPHGIILVTGPTGSGKSTTLYTVLSELNGSDVNIITVEDPVEADVEGINQVQTNDKAGLTFASALRSILRQDPDIIMIGEIRDEETANIAVKAAITGHLVVSTLHTNSAATTVTRLADMGIEPYMIADSTVGIIAQRLVKRLCPKCKVPHEMTELDKKRLRMKGNGSPVIYEPGGGNCVLCNGTGYRGRIGVYEIMPISQKIRTVISDNGTAEEIQDVALEEGMTTLRNGAAKLVIQGVTSIAEVERIATE